MRPRPSFRSTGPSMTFRRADRVWGGAAGARTPLLSPSGLLLPRVRAAACAILVLVLTRTTPALAQTISATTYPFTTTAGPELEDQSSGTTQLLGANVDDAASSVTTMGFDFWFVGTRYTQFSVNSNGLIRLGSAQISGTAANDLTTASNLPAIAPYWDDIFVGTNGKVHYKVVGTAPNRKLVVEW